MQRENAEIPVAILVRVSTAKQETARQISELLTYADAKAYEVVEVCEETIPRHADERVRHGLRRAEELSRSIDVRYSDVGEETFREAASFPPVCQA
jgi:hypothetical protein